MFRLKKNGFMVTSDQTINLDGFTSLQTHGIQAYWHEKSPTEENSVVLMERRDVFSKKERHKGIFSKATLLPHRVVVEIMNS